MTRIKISKDLAVNLKIIFARISILVIFYFIGYIVDTYFIPSKAHISSSNIINLTIYGITLILAAVLLCAALFFAFIVIKEIFRTIFRYLKDNISFNGEEPEADKNIMMKKKEQL
ncbi:MAG: hypothetical protein RBT59_09295 [Arcobacteraceae bacterium]|jgi:hypothetical protein|nr:hypothetical protein [Arcobacteraceae bacterium]